MLTLKVSCLIACLVYAAVGAFVLARDPRRPLFRAFTLMTAGLFLTAAGSLVRALAETEDAARDGTLAIQAGLIVLPWAIHRFTTAFLGPRHHPFRLVGALTAASIPFLAAASLLDRCAGTAWIMRIASGPEGWYPSEHGPVGRAQTVLFLSIVVLNVVRTFSGHAGAPGVKRVQIRYYGLGFAALAITATLSVAFRQTAAAAFGGLFWYLCIAYAITRHQFLDIQVVIRLGAVYGSVSAILLGAYAGLVAAVTSAFDRLLAADSWAFPFLGMAAIALCFEPLRNRVQAILDRAFFRQQMDFRKALEDLSPLAAQATRPADLQTILEKTLAPALHPQSVRLWVRAEPPGGPAAAPPAYAFRPVLAGGPATEAGLAAEDPLVARLRATRRPVERGEVLWRLEELAALPLAETAERGVLRALDRLEADLAVPLVRNDDLPGLLVLGPKRSGDPYRRAEIGFAVSVAAQAALTLQNLRLHEQARAMESRLHEADKFSALGVLASEVAHEVRNPLSVIKNYVRLLPEKAEDPAFRERFQNRVSPEIERVEDILTQLLETASGRRGTVADVSLADIARATLDFLSDDLVRQDIVVERDWNGSLRPLAGDAARLRQVFQNLVLNAAQAMPKGGRLRLRIREDAAAVRVEVSDTGPGIPPEQLPHLFRPFATTKPGGTGLGLAISRRIVQEHGGTVRVDSHPGAGTTFILEFPSGTAGPVS